MFRSMPRIVLPPMVVVPQYAGETVVVVKDRLMDLPVNPNFTQFRSREPADSRVAKFVKAYTKANCEVRANMVLEEAITWPKMLVKAFEKMHQMRKVGWKKAASLKRQSKPRNPESLKVRDIREVLAADPLPLDSEEELTLAEPDIESDEEEATNSKDGGGGDLVSFVDREQNP